MSPTILVVEDDNAMRTGLTDNLEYEGYQVICADNGDDGLRIAIEDAPDLLLLDIMLPAQDGISVCRQLRQNGCTFPIIMLTAKGEEIDKVVGLEIGADDYVTKPFSVRELLARIRSQLRRTRMQSDSQDQCAIGDALVTFANHTLNIGEQQIALSHGESEILRLLASRRGEVISREEFIEAIEDGKRFTNTRALDNCIVRLRRKIEPDPANPVMILTVHGMGYKLAERISINPANK